MTSRLTRFACLTLGLPMLITTSAYAQSCEPIQFDRGAYSGTVEGVAPPDGTLCYTVATGAGQRAKVAVAGRNVMFSIAGVVDAQDAYHFTTEQKTYRILVGQLMRSVTEEPFTLTVSVR